MRLTGAKTKREAVVIAIEEYNRRRRLARLADELGSFEGFPSRQELEYPANSHGAPIVPELPISGTGCGSAA